MAGTGVGKFSSTASNNTSNLTVNFAENMAPSNVNNAARELMGHMRDMYEQLGDGYFEFGDGDGTYTVARSDADTITITSSADISSVYFAGRKIRITDGGANVVEGTIASSSHSSTTQTVNLTGISLASGAPTKVELGIDTAAFGGRVILDDDGDTYIEAVTDDTIDIYVAGAKDFVITANTFTAESGSTIAAQALTATSITATGDISLDGGSFVFNESSADKDFRVESNGNTHQFFVDAGNDRIYVGGGTGSSIGSNKFQVQNGGATISSFANDSGSSQLHFIKSRNTTVGSQTIVNDGDSVGGIFWKADDGDATDYNNNVAGIEGVIDGTPGTNDTPGRLVFYTTADGARTNTERMRITSTGTVGIGTSSPQTTLHLEATAPILRISDSNSTSEDDAVGKIQFYDRNNTDLNAEIISGTGSLADLILSAHNNRAVILQTNGNTERLRATGDGKIGIGEASPDADAGGLTLNHGANDGKILTFKSSDVAHSMTSIAEADTYGVIGKAGANDGGIQMVSMNDSGTVALQILGISNGGEDTGKGTGDHGCVRIDAASRSGTSLGSQGSNVNMVTICNNNTVRFIFDAEGDFHADSGSTTFDAYQDAQLVRAYDLSHGKGVIASKFDKFVQYNASDLTDAGLVGKVNNEYNEDGTKATPLINMSGFMRLHNGAIWQQYEKTERLANAMYELAKAAVGEDKANEILKQNEIKLLN